MSNSVTIYEQITAAATALSKIINHYSSLWEDNSNIVNVSEKK